MNSQQYQNQVESDTAKSIRFMKEALKKPGGKTYQNAVELQKAQERHRNRMKEELKVV